MAGPTQGDSGIVMRPAARRDRDDVVRPQRDATRPARTARPPRAGPDDERLNRHVAAAVSRQVPRGWVLERATRSDKIDGAMALLMAVDRAENRPDPVRLVGWL